MSYERRNSNPNIAQDMVVAGAMPSSTPGSRRGSGNLGLGLGLRRELTRRGSSGNLGSQLGSLAFDANTRNSISDELIEEEGGDDADARPRYLVLHPQSALRRAGLGLTTNALDLRGGASWASTAAFVTAGSISCSRSARQLPHQDRATLVMSSHTLDGAPPPSPTLVGRRRPQLAAPAHRPERASAAVTGSAGSTTAPPCRSARSQGCAAEPAVALVIAGTSSYDGSGVPRLGVLHQLARARMLLLARSSSTRNLRAARRRPP